MPNIILIWELIKEWPEGNVDRGRGLERIGQLMANFEDPAFAIMSLTILKLYKHKKEDKVKNQHFKDLNLTAILNLVDELRF